CQELRYDCLDEGLLVLDPLVIPILERLAFADEGQSLVALQMRRALRELVMAISGSKACRNVDVHTANGLSQPLEPLHINGGNVVDTRIKKGLDGLHRQGNATVGKSGVDLVGPLSRDRYPSVTHNRRNENFLAVR